MEKMCENYSGGLERKKKPWLIGDANLFVRLNGGSSLPSRLEEEEEE